MTLRAMQQMKAAARALCFLIIFLTLAAVPVFAQEGEASPADSTTGWIFRWLNFALVFGAIAYALVKYAAPAFRAQTDEISRKSRKARAPARPPRVRGAKSRPSSKAWSARFSNCAWTPNATPKPKRSACAIWAAPKRKNRTSSSRGN